MVPPLTLGRREGVGTKLLPALLYLLAIQALKIVHYKILSLVKSLQTLVKTLQFKCCVALFLFLNSNNCSGRIVHKFLVGEFGIYACKELCKVSNLRLYLCPLLLLVYKAVERYKELICANQEVCSLFCRVECLHNLYLGDICHLSYYRCHKRLKRRLCKELQRLFWRYALALPYTSYVHNCR